MSQVEHSHQDDASQELNDEQLNVVAGGVIDPLTVLKTPTDQPQQGGDNPIALDGGDVFINAV